MGLSLAMLLLSATVAAAAPARITGIEAGVFSDRELVVVRHEGGVSLSPRYTWRKDACTLTIVLRNATASKVTCLKPAQPIIRMVELSPVPGKNQAVLKLTLVNGEIIERQNWRFGNYSRQIVLVELFPLKTKRNEAPKIRNLERFWQRGLRREAARAPLPEEQVLHLSIPAHRLDAALRSHNLYSPDIPFTVISEGAGTISTPHGQFGLDELLAEDAVDELLLVGPPDAITSARKAIGSADASLEESQPDSRDREPAGSDSAAANGSMDTDYPPLPPGGHHGPATYQELKQRLSDILVNLNATQGLNLWSTIMLLSRMSGVSIIIDPYAVEAPTGSRRKDLVEAPGSEGGGPSTGFREAREFQPESLQGPTNTVIGNFAQVPFDLALEIVLNTHNLSYLVFSTPDSDFTKPVILITSKERMEQEIAGANRIDLYQEHYADPMELYSVLDNMDLLPSRERGWYVYQGGYGGYGRAGRGGAGGRGGGGGGAGGGRGGGGGVGPGMRFEGFIPTRPQALLIEVTPGNREAALTQFLRITAQYPELTILDIQLAPEREAADEEAQDIHRALVLCLP